MKPLLFAFLIAIVSLTQSAGAFVNPPALAPEVAQPGQVVNLHLTTGVCDGVLGGANNPAITINGQSIDVLIDAIRRFDPLFCPFPTVNHVWPIGTFGPGTYSVTVRYRFTPFGLPTVIEALGVLPLQVQGTPATDPRPVPATNWPFLALMVIAILLIGKLYSDKVLRVCHFDVDLVLGNGSWFGAARRTSPKAPRAPVHRSSSPDTGSDR